MAGGLSSHVSLIFHRFCCNWTKSWWIVQPRSVNWHRLTGNFTSTRNVAFHQENRGLTSKKIGIAAKKLADLKVVQPSMAMQQAPIHWSYLPFLKAYFSGLREYHHKIWPKIWYTTSILGTWNVHWFPHLISSRDDPLYASTQWRVEVVKYRKPPETTTFFMENKVFSCRCSL